MGSVQDRFGIVYDRFRFIFGSIGDRCGNRLGIDFDIGSGSIWDQFEIGLGSVWDPFGIVFGSVGDRLGLA